MPVIPELKPITNGKGSFGGLWAILNMIGGISGLISLLTVALFVGALKKQVEVDSHRLDVIEAGGSPTLQATVKMLNAEIEARKDNDASLQKRTDDIRSDFNNRMDHITSLLEKQIEQQTALIALIRAQQQTRP